MCEALFNSVDIKFGLCEVLGPRHKNETPMKAKKQASDRTSFDDDDHGKLIMDYEHPGTSGNIRTINRDGVSAQLEAFIECKADITAIQEMRWIGQGCKSQAHWDIY